MCPVGSPSIHVPAHTHGAGRPKILFVTATRIGDAVLSTALLKHFLDRFPGAGITIAAGPASAPLFLGVPRLQQLIVLRKQRFARHWLNLYRQAVGAYWDWVIDLRGSALAWLLPARHRLVIAKGDPDRHRLQQLADSAGVASLPAPHLWLRAEDIERAQQLISPASGPVLALGPAANWRGKQWPGRNFAILAQRLIAPGGGLAGAKVAVFASPQEREQCRPIFDTLAANETLDLIDCGDLLTVAAALRRTRLFIGNDSGLMHMAAAMGVPTLGLFGPSRDSHYAPWGAHCAVARTPASAEELTGGPDFDHRTTDTLMAGLSVERVEAAAADLLKRTAPCMP